MTEGLSPDGKHYFPVFPYTSFTLIKNDDLLHLKDYLFSLPAVKVPNREHDVTFPFNWRGALDVWKKLFFNPGPFKADPDRSESWNRGAYISEALAHCGECHTPRSMMGALDSSMHFAGSLEGPEGELSPNITQDRETGIGEWSRGDLTWLLKTGMKPGGDDVQGDLAGVEGICAFAGDAPQGRGVVGVGQAAARLDGGAVGEEIGGGRGEGLQPLALFGDQPGQPRRDGEAVLGQRDGLVEEPGPVGAAPALVGGLHQARRAGGADGEPAHHRVEELERLARLVLNGYRAVLAGLNPGVPEAALDLAVDELCQPRSGMDKVRANRAVWEAVPAPGDTLPTLRQDLGL